MLSKARVKAIKKYLETKDQIIFRVEKGRKERIKFRAESLGLSLNAYINGLIEKDMGPLD